MMSRPWGRIVQRVGLAVGLAVALLVTAVTPAQAAQHQGGAIAVYWNFHGANGFWNIDQYVRVLQKSHHSYWAMQWGFTATPNEGGYMGLQTDGIRFDGSRGEMAIFSLWNANASRGTCGPFGGEGTGLSCRVPYSFSTNVYYRYRVWRLEADTGGQWWGAWMINMSTGAETHIGSIRVARTKTLTTTPLNFSEYWGDAVACDNVPVSVADFTQPAANSLGGGRYEFGSVYSSFSRGGCTGGSVNVVDLGTTKAARTTLGGP
jgi:hypothetical protein